MTEHATTSEQLAALAELDASLQSHAIAYWLFGGWAVDFHVGRVTRAHGDLDIAVWSLDRARIAELLDGHGWRHRGDADGDGYTCYERGPIRLEIAFLARDDDGPVYTPIEHGRAEWPAGTFGDDVAELLGVHARIVGRAALVEEKSTARTDPTTAAKDRADVASLTGRV